jgi:hypothetical protein
MASPVLDALVNARMASISNTDHAIEVIVVELLGSPPKYDDSSPVDFMKWCDGKGLPWRPAAPAAVALWIFEHAGLGTDALLAEVAKISAAHCSKWLSDPTTGWPVGAALSAITKIERPRSWPKDLESQWQGVPYALKSYLVRREHERDNGIRRAQNERADALKKLHALQSIVKGTTSETVECRTGEEIRT